MQTNLKETFWEEYEKLPDIIKDALFSEKNYNIVSEVCEKNGLNEEELKSQLMKYIGKTLMGKLPIKEFFVTIELEMELETSLAKKISDEIDRRIFSHLRIDLNKLYSSNIAKKENLSNNKNTDSDKKTLVQNDIEEGRDPYKEPLI